MRRAAAPGAACAAALATCCPPAPGSSRISEILGHATVAFTMDTYTEVAEELADAAAAAIAALIPRRSRPPAT